MKIEKISETQVKFILSKLDLEERDIKISELAYGSEKTHRLFQEMMRQAYTECNFESDNTPLMVEAMPVGTSHVVIVVTKIAGASGCGFANNRAYEPAVPVTAPQKENMAIFSFSHLDEAIDASKRLDSYFMGQSRLYKCDGRYFLVIEEEPDTFYDMAEYRTALHEYGERHFATEISEYYLMEHGEPIISCQAIEKLAMYL